MVIRMTKDIALSPTAAAFLKLVQSFSASERYAIADELLQGLDGVFIAPAALLELVPPEKSSEVNSLLAQASLLTGIGLVDEPIKLQPVDKDLENSTFVRPIDKTPVAPPRQQEAAPKPAATVRPAASSGFGKSPFGTPNRFGRPPISTQASTAPDVGAPPAEHPKQGFSKFSGQNNRGGGRKIYDPLVDDIPGFSMNINE